MAGVHVEGGKSRRRALDSDINMIPMIDLLMVTISFLLITAVWVHSQRLEVDAKVPGPPTIEPPCPGCKEEPKLHIETADPAKFSLVWKQGNTVVRSLDVPRESASRKGTLVFPGLAARIAEEHQASGVHRDATDRRFDRAVVHASNDMPYAELIAVMDAVSDAKRPVTAGGKTGEARAFDITFAVD